MAVPDPRLLKNARPSSWKTKRSFDTEVKVKRGVEFDEIFRKYTNPFPLVMVSFTIKAPFTAGSTFPIRTVRALVFVPTDRTFRVLFAL